MNVNKLFLAARHPAAIRLPIEGRLPSFDGATEWLNSPPITMEDLSGKVVLIDFWTFTCINWLRTLPYVRAWNEKYRDQGLVVIGVHTPEFSFEHDTENVRRSVKEAGIEYPVAVDNDYAIWSAFDNHYWPAVYIADAQGRIRYHHFGEEAYEQSEMILQRLLIDAGNDSIDHELVSVTPQGAEVAADWGHLRSPENYLGAERTDNFASPGGAILERSHIYTAPTRFSLNHWALVGDWTVKSESITLNQANGRIVYRFHARDVNLVMGPAVRGKSIGFRVFIDGQAPDASHGVDVDEQGNGTVTEQRLYQLIRQPGHTADHQFEIEFLEAGIQAFSFTFG